jgi:hypothetical protein
MSEDIKWTVNFVNGIICVLEIPYISVCMHAHTRSIKNALRTSVCQSTLKFEQRFYLI